MVEDTPEIHANGGVMVRFPELRYVGTTAEVLAQKPTGYNYDLCPGRRRRVLRLAGARAINHVPVGRRRRRALPARRSTVHRLRGRLLRSQWHQQRHDLAGNGLRLGEQRR